MGTPRVLRLLAGTRGELAGTRPLMVCLWAAERLRVWRRFYPAAVDQPVRANVLRCARVNPFRTAVPLSGQSSQIPSSLSPERDCGTKGVAPVRAVLINNSTAVPFWGQTT